MVFPRALQQLQDQTRLLSLELFLTFDYSVMCWGTTQLHVWNRIKEEIWQGQLWCEYSYPLILQLTLV